MIVANRTHQIAVLVVQINPHDRAGGSDVEARVMQQALADCALRLAGIPGQRRDPERVDLHHSQIGRAVSIRCSEPETSGFDHLDRWQNMRREVIECGDQRETC